MVLKKLWAILANPWKQRAAEIRLLQERFADPKARVYIKDNGTWKPVQRWQRVNGAWVRVLDE